jgi:hypothetical protein
MNMNFFQKSAVAFLVIVVGLWLTLFFTQTTEGFYNYVYSFLFGLLPLIGGGYAMFRSRIWGGTKSAVGKAVFFIGLGLFCWGAGESIWSYYNFFLQTAAPYPSLADVGFAPSIFFYGLGAFYLSRATGAKYGLRDFYAKVFFIIAPFLILIFSYYLLIVVARGGILVPDGETHLKALLDILYPLGDFVGLMIAILISGLSFRYMGGKYLYDIIAILGGLGVMFIADTVFSYTTTIGTYYNGDVGDLILAIGLFLLTYGVLGFAQVKTLGELSTANDSSPVTT